MWDIKSIVFAVVFSMARLEKNRENDSEKESFGEKRRLESQLMYWKGECKKLRIGIC